MDLVLDLPQVLAADVLLGWLRAKDLCMYDNAMCNYKHRPKLSCIYDMLQDVHDVVTTLPKTAKANVGLIQWAGARNIKITNFKFRGDEYWDEFYGHTEVVQNFLKQGGHHLARLTITRCDRPMNKVMALLTNTCCHLDTLTVKDCELPYSIPQMLMRKGNHIRDLYLETLWCERRMVPKSYFANVTSHTVERFRLLGTLEIGCLQEVGRAFPNLQAIHLRVEFTKRENCRDHSILLCDGSQCWLDFIATCNPQLRTIGLCECGSLTMDIFKLLLNTWKQLSSLEVLNCKHLNGLALYLIPKCQYYTNTLQCLTYGGNYKPDAELVSALVYCKALRALHIYCSIVDDTALSELLTKIPTLRELDLRNTSREPIGYTLSVVANYGAQLEVFNYTPLIRTYQGITPYAWLVTKLVHRCKNLRVLRIVHDHDAAKLARPELQVGMCSKLPWWCQV